MPTLFSKRNCTLLFILGGNTVNVHHISDTIIKPLIVNITKI